MSGSSTHNTFNVAEAMAELRIAKPKVRKGRKELAAERDELKQAGVSLAARLRERSAENATLAKVNVILKEEIAALELINAALDEENGFLEQAVVEERERLEGLCLFDDEYVAMYGRLRLDRPPDARHGRYRRRACFPEWASLESPSNSE